MLEKERLVLDCLTSCTSVVAFSRVESAWTLGGVQTVTDSGFQQCDHNHLALEMAVLNSSMSCCTCQELIAPIFFSLLVIVEWCSFKITFFLALKN